MGPQERDHALPAPSARMDQVAALPAPRFDDKTQLPAPARTGPTRCLPTTPPSCRRRRIP
ncbi:hypothetical protein WJ968_30630 [Achromobacter xylosoxidans]